MSESGHVLVWDLDRTLGSHLHFPAVDVQLKDNSFVADLRLARQTEDLEATAVGKDGTIPTRETMQPAQRANGVLTRSNRKMVGVAQNQASAGRLDLINRQTFDCAECTDRHKDGGAHATARGYQLTSARCALVVRAVDREAKALGHREFPQ